MKEIPEEDKTKKNYDKNRQSHRLDLFLYDSVSGNTIWFGIRIHFFLIEDKTKPKEKLSEDLFQSFLHFNNRRIDCRSHNVDHMAFFIFIWDYLIIDADILTKLTEQIHLQLQFHMIVPVLFHKRKFLLPLVEVKWNIA